MRMYSDLTTRLCSLAEPLPEPGPDDWLTSHPEKGQTFRQYVAASPVCREPAHTHIALTLIGELSEPHLEVIEATQAWLGLFFDLPVRTVRSLSIEKIPTSARRWRRSGEQILTNYLIDKMMIDDQPEALTRLAVTTADLWPGDGWNFVFGEADLRRRAAVWSLARLTGDTLRRSLLLATHEACHTLTMKHCIAHRCMMNGGNHLAEFDATPLWLCPICLRKLLWNLQVEPSPYLARLSEFLDDHSVLGGDWYANAVELLRDQQ